MNSSSSQVSSENEQVWVGLIGAIVPGGPHLLDTYMAWNPVTAQMVPGTAVEGATLLR